MHPFTVAAKGKGYPGLLKRVSSISGRYGLTARKMNHVLTHFAQLLEQYDGAATFPVTTAALVRNKGVITRRQSRHIEFAVHGLYHVDHTRLPLHQQLQHLERSRHLFAESGLACSGFRCPYLRWNEDTLTALTQAGFLYDSSQALAWNVASVVDNEAYQRVLTFYGALPAEHYPALPRLHNGLVEIPYCLPDDEALVERFQCRGPAEMNPLWQTILTQTYLLGELFTLGLHPERILACESPLKEVLQQARQLSPGVWIARLDQIARWWQARSAATVRITSVEAGVWELKVDGPAGTTLIGRGVTWHTPATAWYGPDWQAEGTRVRLWAPRRPFIGLSPASDPALASFLRQQGYIVEEAPGGEVHACYLDRPSFRQEDERPLLAQLESGDFPLVRLGRWPDGARSALCITGDIDALTLWDYSLRFLGR